VHLRSGQVSHVAQLAVATFAPGSRTERHSHPTMTEIFHVKAGRGSFLLDNGAVEELDVGDTVAVLPGAYHVVANDGTDSLVMLYVSIPV
jgi:quercetin dioxygenase-like cupin family protein